MTNRVRDMSFFWQSMSDYLTPQGMKTAVDLLTSPKMTVGGGTIMDNIYDLYRTHVKVQAGGGNAKLTMKLTKEAQQKIQTFLTSKRVLRGGASISEIFLKVVSPHGFEMIQKAVGGASKRRSTGGATKASASSKSVKSGGKKKPKSPSKAVTIRQRGGKWWWPFCDDSSSADTVAIDGAAMKTTLPNAAAINNLPGHTPSTQSLEMLKLTSLFDRANSLGNQNVPSMQSISPPLPKVLNPAATSYTADASTPYNAYFRL